MNKEELIRDFQGHLLKLAVMKQELEKSGLMNSHKWRWAVKFIGGWVSSIRLLRGWLPE